MYCSLNEKINTSDYFFTGLYRPPTDRYRAEQSRPQASGKQSNRSSYTFSTHHTMEDITARSDLVEDEKIENEGESVDEWGPPEYYHSNVNVDEVLKELVERKSKLQSFTQFNLDYAVDVSI